MNFQRNKNFIHILAEGDLDGVFYNLCIEKIIDEDFELINRPHRGGGIDSVKKDIPKLLMEILYTGHVENTFFVVTIDNDRCKPHPHHEVFTGISKLPQKMQCKTCRFCEIQKMIKEKFGEEEALWPIKGAIAVPVQMLESWLLLICNAKKYKNEKSLPAFSSKTRLSVQKYYSPKKPPEQLKDLKQIEMQRLRIEIQDDFIQHCAERLDVEDLVKRAPSFALFKRQIESWRNANALGE